MHRRIPILAAVVATLALVCGGLAGPGATAYAASQLPPDAATPTHETAPMPYATRADLDARFGAAEIDDVAAADSDDADARPDAAARVAAVLADASAEMDAVLADGYALPLPAGEYPLLTAACCDIARMRLYDDAAPERVMGRASSARKRVRQLAAGELHLVAADGTRVERRATILVDAGEPVATRDRLAGYLGPSPAARERRGRV